MDSLNWDIIGIVFSLIVLLLGYYVFTMKMRRVRRFRKNIENIQAQDNEEKILADLRTQQVFIEGKYNANKITDAQFIILRDMVSDMMGTVRKRYVNRRMKNIPGHLRTLLLEQLEDGIITVDEFEDFRNSLRRSGGLDSMSRNELEAQVQRWMMDDKKWVEKEAPKSVSSLGQGLNVRSSRSSRSSLSISPSPANAEIRGKKITGVDELETLLGKMYWMEHSLEHTSNWEGYLEVSDTGRNALFGIARDCKRHAGVVEGLASNIRGVDVDKIRNVGSERKFDFRGWDDEDIIAELLKYENIALDIYSRLHLLTARSLIEERWMGDDPEYYFTQLQKLINEEKRHIALLTYTL